MRSWWGSCVLLLCACCIVPAQTAPPRPGGESATVWTAAEANAMAIAAQIAAFWSEAATGQRGPAPGRAVGYAIHFARPAADGAWQFTSHDPTRLPAAGDVLCYLVPCGGEETARRAVCVRGDGVIAFTDNTAGTGRPEGRSVAADDALADGGKGTLRDFPRTPATGRDGNLWLPAEVAPCATLRVTVSDEGGERLGAVTVFTTVAAADEGVDALVPAATARTRLEGDAALQGVPAHGLAFGIMVQGTTVMLAREAVRIEGAVARLTVSRQQLHRARVHRNESAAIATLKNISSAQAQCQAMGIIDVNQNGAGEYGTFAELTGRDPVRGGAKPIVPPVLSVAFAKIEAGVATRSGYHFRLFLPAKDGTALPELDRGGPDAGVDAAQSETVWCLYAWPVEPGSSGQRAFFIDQSGDVRAAPNEDGRYAGTAKPPAPGAARAAGSAGRLVDEPAANAQGLDGQVWRIVL